MSKHSEVKQILYKKCLEYVEQRINNVQLAIADATESANSESKGSAGDKHETGRAMAQLEQEKGSKQLLEALELKKLLDKINPEQSSTKVALGSIALTDKGNFYISISAGKLMVGKVTYFAVSPTSPIALAMLGTMIKQRVKFNGQTYTIVEVC